MRNKAKWLVILAAVMLAFQVAAQDKEAVVEEKPAVKAIGEEPTDEKDSVLETQMQKVSYAIGMNMAKNFQMQGIEIDVDMMVRGLKDVLAGNESLMTDAEIRTVMMAFQAELQAKQQEKMKVDSDKNTKEGEAFLAENKKKEGVVTLDSGLQYKIIKEGEGEKPSKDDTVSVHYKGTLVDGTKFDSSYDRGQPAEFKVGGVIPGWTEALQLMTVGSKWQLCIPSDLAYGERQAGPVIGPNSTLIFEVELLEIK